MSTSVKFIHSGMRGAPQITGNSPGSLIAALDTMFTTGCGLVTAVSVSVTGGVATATVPSGQTFDRDAVVLVAGATPSALNGEARVLSSSSTQITFATTAPDGAATGTITIKYAPQTSWVKAFAGTNKAAYKSNHVQSNGHYLRVDDTGTTTARIRGFETMTDVDTGVGPFPTDAQQSGGGYWYKSSAANSTPVTYRIFCDERFLIVAIAAGYAQNAANTGAPARGFGDPISAAAGGDAWNTLVSAIGSVNTAYALTGSFDSNFLTSSTGGVYCPRAFSGLGGAVAMATSSYLGASQSGNDSSGLGTAPSSVDGRIRTSKLYTRNLASQSPVRSDTPGVLYFPHSGLYGALNDGDFLDGAGDLLGRRLLIIGTNSNYASVPNGAYGVDITGPWR